MKTQVGRVIFIRHGESVWNVTDSSRGLVSRFTGWADVDLTERGVHQAAAAGRCLKLFGIKPDAVFTSLLKRSILTFYEVGKEVLPNSALVPVIHSWRLNERHYGALVGLSKDEAGAKLGEENLLEWRRSWDKAPPCMDTRDINNWRKASWAQPLTRVVDKGRKINFDFIEKNMAAPGTESLRDCADRIRPLWLNAIAPRIARGETVLVIAHANSIRALVKTIDCDTMSLENLREVRIPSATPLVYDFEAVSIPPDLQGQGQGETTANKQGTKNIAIRPIGTPTSLGMTGRYLSSKELVQLSLARAGLVSETLNDMHHPQTQTQAGAGSGSDDAVGQKWDGFATKQQQRPVHFYDLVERGLKDAFAYSSEEGQGKDDAIIITDNIGNIIHINDAWELLCGFSSMNVIGRSNKFLQGPLTNMKSIREIDLRLETGLPVRSSFINYRKSGVAFINNLTVLPVYDWFHGYEKDGFLRKAGPSHYVARLDKTPDRPDLPPLTEEEKQARLSRFNSSSLS